MLLKLTVYKDESMTEVKRVVKADRLKIPYRVAMYLIQSLDGVDLDDEDEIINLITKNVDKVDKIVKATFGVSESELDCIDGAELVTMLKDLYSWAIGKANSLKTEGSEKN